MTLPPDGERRHVCIVLLSGLGDVVHGLPVVNAIRRTHPAWRVTWVVESMPAGLLLPHPAIDRVITFDRRKGWQAIRALSRALSGERFDLTLNFNIYFKSVVPTALSRAPRRLGFGRDRARDLSWLACNEHLAAGPTRHTQDLFLEFLDHLHIAAAPLEWKLSLTEDERAAADAFFGKIDRPVVAIPAVSGKVLKDWPAERYIPLVDALDSEFGFQVVLIGGPGARESAIAQHIVRHAAVHVIDARGDGVRRLIRLIGGSRLVIAPDTGPLHIARALDVPVIGLYGHTNPWRVGPYRRFEDLWVDRYNEPGAPPDASLADPRHGRMEMIAVEDVLERVQCAVDRYLHADPGTPPARASVSI